MSDTHQPPNTRKRAPGSSGRPDLWLMVVERSNGGESRLEYQLLGSEFANRAHAARYESGAFERDPVVHVRSLFREIETWPRQDAKARDQSAKRLLRNGLALARQLLPEAVRSALWDARDEVLSLEIVSNETWVPWEMLAIDGGDLGGSPKSACVAYEGGFLAELFDLTRWPEGLSQHADLGMHRMAVVAPRDAGLKGAVAECSALHRPPGSTRHVNSVPATLDDVLTAMSTGAYDAWHFSGHGVSPGDDPRQWGIVLQDHDRLTPADVEGRIRQAFRAQRPWVFLNACHTSRGGRALAGGGGLAKAFLDAGASAYVGALWAIDDNVAHAFAPRLYAELMAGQPLGAAVRRTRLAMRDAYPGDPTWLAYTAYGHPMARLRGTAAAGVEESTVAPPVSDVDESPLRVVVPPPSSSGIDQTSTFASVASARKKVLGQGQGQGDRGKGRLDLIGIGRSLIVFTFIAIAWLVFQAHWGDQGRSLLQSPKTRVQSADHLAVTKHVAQPGAPAFIESAAMIISVNFDTELEGTCALHIAPEGEASTVKGMTFAMRSSYVVRTRNGRWRVTVIDIDSLRKQIAVRVAPTSDPPTI